nr:RNA cytidine acetyltransferase 1-like [Tanacetum cinerariifolium]
MPNPTASAAVAAIQLGLKGSVTIILPLPSHVLSSLLGFWDCGKKMVRKKVDERVRTLIRNGVEANHRSFFVIVGDKSRDQIVSLHYMLRMESIDNMSRPKNSNVLWCYRNTLELSRACIPGSDKTPVGKCGRKQMVTHRKRLKDLVRFVQRLFGARFCYKSKYDKDAERNMIRKLKMKCGSQLTLDMEDMLNDMEVSRDNMDEFRSSRHVPGDGPKLSVLVLKVSRYLSLKRSNIRMWIAEVRDGGGEREPEVETQETKDLKAAKSNSWNDHRKNHENEDGAESH